MRFVIMGILLLFLNVKAQAQDKKECTKEYLEELRDDKLGIEGLKKMSVDQLRPICKVISVSEGWAGKVIGPLGGSWALDKVNEILGTSVDPKIVSNMCKWIRVTGEKILIPDDELKRIELELARCAKVDKKD